MLGNSTKKRDLVNTSSTWLHWSLLLLVIAAVMKIEARNLSNRPQGYQQNNAAYLHRQHQLALTKTNSTRKPENADQINCAKGGAKRYKDAKDETKFHMCSFSTAHRIWMVYSFNCPKQTIFDVTSQKCGSRASINNAPPRRVAWDHRFQQSLGQKVQPGANHLKAKPGSLGLVVNSSTNSSHSSNSSKINNLTTTQKPTLRPSPLSNQYNKQHYQYQNIRQKGVVTTTSKPNKNYNLYQYNRPRPGQVTQVNRRYPTIATRRPPSTRTTTTTIRRTTTTERSTTTAEPEPELLFHSPVTSSRPIENPSNFSLIGGEIALGSESNAADASQSEKQTGNSHIGVIRTVAGKIAYLAQAIESMLTAFESSMGIQVPCVNDNQGVLNGNAKVDILEVGSDGKVPEESTAQLDPSDFNILDFFTLNNPVNKEIVNKIITMSKPSTSSRPNPSSSPISIPTSSSTTNEQNDPEDHDVQQTQGQTDSSSSSSSSSSEGEQMSEEEAAVRLPSPSKEFDLKSPQPQSLSTMMVEGNVDAPAETTATSVHSSVESENQIQQSEPNVEGGEEEEESLEPAEWNIIIKKPTDPPTRTSTLDQILQFQDESSPSTVSTSTGSAIDDFSSLAPVDDALSNVKTSNEKLSAQGNIMFSAPTKFPISLPSHALNSHSEAVTVGPAITIPSGSPSSSVVSNEQADILKIGSKGSNRRPRRQRRYRVNVGEESDFSLTG